MESWDQKFCDCKTDPNNICCPLPYLRRLFLCIFQLSALVNSFWLQKVFLTYLAFLQKLFRLRTHYSSVMPKAQYCLSSGKQTPFPGLLWVAVWDCCPGPAAEEGATPSPEQTVPPHLGTSTASPWRQLGMISWLLHTGSQKLAAPALALSATHSVILAWHRQRRHHCWLQSTLDCSYGNQGQYFGQASHLPCSNTPFQATATGYSHRQDIGLGGPSTAELIIAKEPCKRKYISTQIKFLGVILGIIWPAELWQQGLKCMLRLPDLHASQSSSVKQQFSSRASLVIHCEIFCSEEKLLSS